MDRAERRGLVARRADASDRRAFQIALTDEGARLAFMSYDEITARLESLAEGLRPNDRERLASLVTQIIAEYDAGRA